MMRTSVGFHAVCGKCSEVFCPADEQDVIHLVRDDGSECGGPDVDVLLNFRALVVAIGGGYHPDTAGRDYTDLPDGWTADEVDEVTDLAQQAGIDVYAESCSILDDARHDDELANSRRYALAHGIALGSFEEHQDGCPFGDGTGTVCGCS